MRGWSMGYAVRRNALFRSGERRKNILCTSARSRAFFGVCQDIFLGYLFIFHAGKTYKYSYFDVLKVDGCVGSLRRDSRLEQRSSPTGRTWARTSIPTYFETYIDAETIKLFENIRLTDLIVQKSLRTPPTGLHYSSMTIVIKTPTRSLTKAAFRSPTAGVKGLKGSGENQFFYISFPLRGDIKNFSNCVGSFYFAPAGPGNQPETPFHSFWYTSANIASA